MMRTACLTAWHLPLIALAAVVAGCGRPPGPSQGAATGAAIELLNVSYDPTRELYREVNDTFVRHYAETHGRAVAIKQSHAASGSQARAVIDGL
jgi:sulfate/thiosulfate transport system substrate-binding protein